MGFLDPLFQYTIFTFIGLLSLLVYGISFSTLVPEIIFWLGTVILLIKDWDFFSSLNLNLFNDFKSRRFRNYLFGFFLIFLISKIFISIFSISIGLSGDSRLTISFTKRFFSICQRIIDPGKIFAYLASTTISLKKAEIYALIFYLFYPVFLPISKITILQSVFWSFQRWFNPSNPQYIRILNFRSLNLSKKFLYIFTLIIISIPISLIILRGDFQINSIINNTLVRLSRELDFYIFLNFLEPDSYEEIIKISGSFLDNIIGFGNYNMGSVITAFTKGKDISAVGANPRLFGYLITASSSSDLNLKACFLAVFLVILLYFLRKKLRKIFLRELSIGVPEKLVFTYFIYYMVSSTLIHFVSDITYLKYDLFNLVCGFLLRYRLIL